MIIYVLAFFIHYAIFFVTVFKFILFSLLQNPLSVYTGPFCCVFYDPTKLFSSAAFAGFSYPCYISFLIYIGKTSVPKITFLPSLYLASSSFDSSFPHYQPPDSYIFYLVLLLILLLSHLLLLLCFLIFNPISSNWLLISFNNLSYFTCLISLFLNLHIVIIW